MTAILFYILSAICIISSILMIFHKNAMYSVLVLTDMFFFSGRFVCDAECTVFSYRAYHCVCWCDHGAFPVCHHVSQYEYTDHDSQKQIGHGYSRFTGSSLCFVLVTALWATNFGQNPAIVNQDIGLASTLGKVLFNEFLIPFEVSSVLFLSSMVGIVIFNKKEQKDE
jgi:NADH-quinone oxidoreductase subunit J